MVRYSRTFRAGFSLVESAVILVVVGVVIGGIWVASSVVAENRRVEATRAAIMQIVDGARRLYDLEGFPTSGSVSRESTLISAGVVPQDFVSGSTIKSPWGMAISVEQSYRPGQNGSAATPDIWSISSTSVPYRQCRLLVLRVSGMFNTNKDLVHIQIRDSGTYTQVYTFPVRPTTSVCSDLNNDGVVDSLAFFFAARAA